MHGVRRYLQKLSAWYAMTRAGAACVRFWGVSLISPDWLPTIVTRHYGEIRAQAFKDCYSDVHCVVQLSNSHVCVCVFVCMCVCVSIFPCNATLTNLPYRVRACYSCARKCALFKQICPCQQKRTTHPSGVQVEGGALLIAVKDFYQVPVSKKYATF